MTSEEEYVPLESTKASRLGEFFTEGDWHIIGSFLIIPQYVVNDGNGNFKIIPEQVIGTKRGENLHSCYFCGTPIQEHITFKDRKSGRMVNIGNVCVEKLGEQVGQRNITVMKGLKSLKDKVAREFKKKIHRKDLLEFLDGGMATWQKEINDKVDAELKANEHAFWNPATRTVTKNDKTFELQATLWEQKEGAEQREFGKRNPIKVMRDEFEKMGWNVKPMIPIFEGLISKQGFDVKIPSPRPLNKDELTELSRHIQVNVDEYLKKLEDRAK